MAKVRIGHFVEAQIVQAIGADYIDESEVLTAADEDVRISYALLIFYFIMFYVSFFSLKLAGNVD